MKNFNTLELTIVPIKQKKKIFKIEHSKTNSFIIKPDYIKEEIDDATVNIYKRIRGSHYWRIVGLKDYEFALIVNLHL